jgi:hypothetical protein
VARYYTRDRSRAMNPANNRFARHVSMRICAPANAAVWPH